MTDVVTDEIELWRNRPVDEVYPIVYIDGIRIRVRDKGAVTVKVAHLVIGVDVEGRKHALGVWIAEAEGAKFWLSVPTELRNRGLRDILICCCDGLSGLPEAITTAFPHTVVQTCVVHVIRNAMKFVSYSDRKKLRPACGRSTPLRRWKPPNSPSPASRPNSVNNTPERSTCGVGHGTTSFPSWITHRSCDASCTPQTRSNPSISSSARSPKRGGISRRMRRR